MSEPQLVTPACLEIAPGLAIVPIVHHRVAFASEVRRAVLQFRPECLAIELPSALERPIERLVSELPCIQSLAWRAEGLERPLYLAADPCDGRIEAVRLAREFNLPLEMVDTAASGAGKRWLAMPDPASVESIGAAAFAGQWRESVPAHGFTRRDRLAAGRIARFAASRGRCLVVASVHQCAALRELLSDPLQAADWPDEEEPDMTFHVDPVPPGLLAHYLGEIPRLTYLYELFRPGADVGDAFPVDKGLGQILDTAAERYELEYDESVNLTEWRALYQFGRNLALVRGRLRPSLEELVTAAKSCVDDDYGALVLEVATSYPPNDPFEEEASDRSRHRSRDVYVDFGDGVEKAEPAYPWPSMSELEFHFKRRRATPRQKAEWREEFEKSFGISMCSWPPEDERIEEFFDFLRKRALAQISAEHTLVEEFTSSIQDGLDFRETMRNWHTGKLYVRRERHPPGRVGPVVLIWHDFPVERFDLWRTTLYAEHQNESDIVIYGAPLGQDMVGPMVSRTEYHGVLSIYPARHIPDVWNLPQFFVEWETCARVLLATAIMLCEDKYVAWVAPEPPPGDLVSFGREHGVGIVYLPLAAFSRKTLKRLRTVHILGSKLARGWAGDYIED